MPLEDEKNLARGGNQAVRQHLQSSASETEGLSAPAPEDHEDRFDGEPWCRDFEGHKALHEFCGDHQAMWCRKCDRECPECVDDPHCRYCHCALLEEYHNWDCLYAGDEESE